MKILPRGKRRMPTGMGISRLFLAVALLLGSSAGAEQLTLERALEIASSNSPTMRQATYNLEASEHSLKAQQARLKSRFSLTLKPYGLAREQPWQEWKPGYVTDETQFSEAKLTVEQPLKWTDGTLTLEEKINWSERYLSETRPSEQNPSGGPVRTTDYGNGITLTLRQPLFTYNQTRQETQKLELALERAELDYAVSRLAIEKDVVMSFLNLYYGQQNVEITREEYANASESYNIIASKVEAGITAREELFQADINRANARASLMNIEMQLQNALDRFRIMLGLSLDHEIEALADLEIAAADVNLAQAMNHGLQHRMELRQHDIDIQEALFALIKEGAQNEFRADLMLSYGMQGNERRLAGMFDSPTRTQTIDVALNIPLIDWGEKRHRMAASQTSVDRERLNLDEFRKQIIRDIKSAYRDLQYQQTRVDIAEKNVENARLTYDINLERYRNGDLSTKDLSFYQNQLSREQLNRAAALIDYRLALLDLKIHSLYDFENNEPVVDSHRRDK